MVEPGRVLVVDDEQEIRETVRLLVEPKGFVVVGEAANGIEAVSLALREQPHLIVLDQKMPEMTGEETAATLRNASPSSRILAFSAYLEGCPDWGDGFLAKDRIADIAKVLAAMLERDGVGS